MLLAIDAGNTRIKWAVFAPGASEPLESGACLHQDLLAAPAAWQGCAKALLSNVAGDTVGARIRNLLQGLNIPLHEHTAKAAACGLQNNYDQPEKLGADRWAALIAAWELYQQPCVVVSAGTAITIDAINKVAEGGEFLGGMILPGIRLMQQSLLDGTAGIRESMGQWQDFPTNTANALYSAAITAAAGNVKGMAARLQHRTGQPPLVILTGGDAQLLAECLLETIVMTNQLVIADNLVLQGLLILERAE